jgi:hypothetical protein
MATVFVAAHVNVWVITMMDMYLLLDDICIFCETCFEMDYF